MAVVTITFAGVRHWRRSRTGSAPGPACSAETVEHYKDDPKFLHGTMLISHYSVEVH
jgi:hypothetical protein